VLSAITAQTKAVILSSVHWMSGVKFDLKTIGKKCKAVGAKFIVDGSQSVGALPIDVEDFGIDALINAGYKWLFGPYSMALGYFGSAFDNGRPIEESWMNRDNAEDFSSLSNYSMKYSEMAGRYNVGETSYFIAMPMMRAGLLQVNEWTPERIQEYCGLLTQPVLNFFHENNLALEESDYFSPHLFDLRLPENIDADQLKKTLREQQVIVSSRGKSIRLAFNVFNDEGDVSALLNALKSHF
jgi:selenocysteine lyase/cysteine desulfurase